MKSALLTASIAYGLNGPSATAVDNATPQGITYRQGKTVQTNGTGSGFIECGVRVMGAEP